jgi:hypothetical protein
MTTRPRLRSGPAILVAALAVAGGVQALEPPDASALLSEESLAKFRRLYDPDVPPAFAEPDGVERSSAEGPRSALLQESLGGSWWPGFGAPPAGQGMQSSVNAMLAWGGSLVVAGDFRRAGGEFMYRVAAWNGSSWAPLGFGMNHRVFALKEYQGNLIAGGAFTLADGATANYVASWNGSSWSALDLGPGGPVYTLEVHEGVLYAGGDFPGFLKLWDGARWRLEPPPAAQPTGIVATLKSVNGLGFGPTFVAGGLMTTWGNQGSGTGSFLFRRSGTVPTWLRVNGGANDWVSAMHVVNDTLYFGGNFTAVRNIQYEGSPPCPPQQVCTPIVRARHVAGFKFPPPRPVFFAIGTPFDTLGTSNGLNDAALAISDLPGAIVLGGQFDTATNPGGAAIVANRIATWNRTAWGTLGTGMGGGVHPPYVRALAKLGTDLYAGGWFTSAGGLDSRHIARWLDVPEPALDAADVAAPREADVRVSPSPFGRETEISFASPAPSAVELTIHDVQGRRVRTLFAASGVEGVHTVRWDGRDESGRPLASGVYFVRLARDGVASGRRVVLAR